MNRNWLLAPIDLLVRFFKAAVAFCREPLTHGLTKPEQAARATLRPLRYAVQVYHQVGEDRCLQQASTLSYKTILSTVPTVAVALSLLKAFGAFSGPESPAVRFVAGLVMPPNEAGVLAEKIIEFTAKISFGAIGGIGMLSLILVAVTLLESVDETLNQIWRSQIKRSRFTRFTIFYTMLTLGPLLLTVSLLQSSRLQGLVTSSVLAHLLTIFTPLFVTWFGLVLSYKLFPTAHVHWRPAMLGAALAAIGIEAVKLAFNLFLSESLSTSYAKLYGALALIPLFMVWIYVLWLIVLFGVEYSYIMQNFSLLVQQRFMARRASRQLTLPVQVSEQLACRVLVLVAQRFQDGQPPPSKEELTATLGIELHSAELVVKNLSQAGFLRQQLEVAEGGERELYYPGRGLDRIRLREVITSFRDGARQLGRTDEAPQLEAWLDRVESQYLAALDEVTLAGLLEPAAGEKGPATGSGAAAPAAPARSGRRRGAQAG